MRPVCRIAVRCDLAANPLPTTTHWRIEANDGGENGTDDEERASPRGAFGRRGRPRAGVALGPRLLARMDARGSRRIDARCVAAVRLGLHQVQPACDIFRRSMGEELRAAQGSGSADT